MTGIEIITKERNEQLTKHNRKVEFDVSFNSKGQLRRASRKLLADDPSKLLEYPPEGWNIEIWKHMCSKTYIERLAIVGAFCAAEIDRIKEIENRNEID